jgi:hypothetical protein
MLKGQLWATSDINLVNQALMQGFKVIYLGDPVSIDPVYKEKFVVSTSLVPDYQTMALQVDGNIDGFIQMYMASLNSKAAMEMMSVILVCLFKGVGIIFYLPPEAAGLNFVQYLLQYIEFNFGIRTQTRSTQFMFDNRPENCTKIIELLYLNNLVTAQEFLLNANGLDDMSIRKLVDELHPVVNDPTNLQEIIGWFSRYKDELIKCNMPLINGIQYAGNYGF